MLIRNFGHLWERKFINYGTGGPGNRGHLKGYNGKEEVDFREQIGIYVLFDKDFVPVYIGQAGRGHRRLFDRLNEHETDDLWNRWDHFSWFGFRRVNKKSRTLSRFDSVTKRFSTKGSLLLNEVEGALITAMQPRLNKQGARWRDVKEYYQTKDPAMEEATVGDLIEKFESVEKKLNRLEVLMRGKRANHARKRKKKARKK